MNIRLALAAVCLSVISAPAFSADQNIEQLSQQTGLSERHVRMIVACRTCVAEYPYTYNRRLKQFKAALGESNYERLMSGQPILLPNGHKVAIRVAAK